MDLSMTYELCMHTGAMYTPTRFISKAEINIVTSFRLPNGEKLLKNREKPLVPPPAAIYLYKKDSYTLS